MVYSMKSNICNTHGRNFLGGAVHFLQGGYEQKKSQFIDKQDLLHSAAFLSPAPWAVIYLRWLVTSTWRIYHFFCTSSCRSIKHFVLARTSFCMIPSNIQSTGGWVINQQILHSGERFWNRSIRCQKCGTLFSPFCCQIMPL